MKRDTGWWMCKSVCCFRFVLASYLFNSGYNILVYRSWRMLNALIPWNFICMDKVCLPFNANNLQASLYYNLVSANFWTILGTTNALMHLMVSVTEYLLVTVTLTGLVWMWTWEIIWQIGGSLSEQVPFFTGKVKHILLVHWFITWKRGPMTLTALWYFSVVWTDFNFSEDSLA